MKKKKKYTNSHTLTVIALFVFGISAIFLFFSTGKNNRPSKTFETEAYDLTEKTDQTTETSFQTVSKDTEAELPSTQPAAETFLKQDLERIRALSAGDLAAPGMIAPEQIDHLFYAGAVDDAVFARINGSSYTENDNILISDLSYLKMLYYGFDGNTYVGEMIVNQKIESDVLSIFKTLYENQYPIEKMTLIDAYDANDELSMEDNNTSAFNYRTIAGSSRLSNHSYGMAIDLNPRYNPYVKTSSDGSVLCQPENGRPYADRSREFTYKIDENDLAYRLFTEAGFTWGGSWNSVKDYQHFEKQD